MTLPRQRLCRQTQRSRPLPAFPAGVMDETTNNAKNLHITL